MSDEREDVSKELRDIRSKLLWLAHKTNNNKISNIHNDLHDLILEDFSFDYEYSINKFKYKIKKTEDEISRCIINSCHLTGLQDLFAYLMSYKSQMIDVFEKEIKRLKKRLEKK